MNGNKKLTSRSKMMNNIATRKNLMLNSVRESSKGLNPHSEIDSFSKSSSFKDKK